MKANKSIAMLLGCFLAGMSSWAQIPAFPGAEGFGAYATGGRGGDVYTVTSLNNNGAGTLREALNTAPAGGRTIVFAVSGYIPVVSDTNFQVPSKVTIAGQTAPGDGVGLRGGRMLINGSNTIMRHFRIRHGKYGTGGDCLNIASTAHTTMLDHISMMFSTDENFSFFNSSVDDFTMQYSTSSWGMERHNAGGLWDLVDGSCHHSLWAHHRTRNPKARPNGVLEWINNVTFHWRNEPFIMGDSQTPANWKANVRGCYYVSIDDADDGSTVRNTGLVKATVASNGKPNFSLYLDNTLFDNNTNGIVDGTDRGYAIVAGAEFAPGDPVGANRYYKSATPFPGATGTAAVTIDDPLTAYKKVVSSAGPLRLDANHAGPLRDELDALLMDTVVNQYSILVQSDGKVAGEDPNRTNNGEQLLADQYGISNNGFGTLNPSVAPADGDGDGMPDFWETALGSNPAVQNHNTVFANNGSIITAATFFPPATPAGYTYLEEYLHFCAIPHAWLVGNTAAQPSSLRVDLRRYTGGFTNGAAFTIGGTYGGTVQQYAANGTTLSSAGPIMVFTPTQNHTGRAGFNFNVTDADGSSWTQQFGIVLVPSESDPPTPNPATFATPPAATGPTKITMAATTGSDASGPVQYYFTCTAGGGHDSGWQTSATYTDYGLSPNAEYAYTVTMRDSALTPNVGAASAPQSAATPATTIFLQDGGVLSMEAENGTLGSHWITGTDAGASSGAYIEGDPAYAHNGSAPAGTTPVHLASYTFGISSVGNHRFWFRMYSTSGINDSFFWRIDEGGWMLENGRSGVGSWFSTDHAQVDSLGIGNHVLEIAYRETGTRLDKFVIQLDSLATPGGEGPAESEAISFSIPPEIGLSIVSGTFRLDWPGNDTGWRLLYSTNLATNVWSEVSGSTTGNVYETPISGLPADQAFYKLVYP